MHTSAGRVCASTLRAIGNTPVVQLCKLVGPDSARVLVKLEYYSPTGSYKDRMALAMIEAAEARGDLRPGMTVVEFSGGSTGSSLAFVCAVKGYRCHIVSSDAFAQEKLRTIRAFGAELTIIPSQGGKITPDLVPRMIEEARRLAQADDVYWTDQLNNADALDGYEQIGRELLAQADDPIHAFCAAVGIGGMLLGAARALRAAVSPARIVVLEPAESPLISRGTAGAHHVEGTGIGIVPPLLTAGSYDEVRAIAEHDARETARHLTRAEGIFAGASTGLNVRAALELARELGPGHTVATVAVDTGLKYLAGDLYSD
ncbi:MAG: cysteine synthase family protein [Chloroflexi bacterium]|nr:cysteine synthase family protein [Chloroflexota bacterium]